MMQGRSEEALKAGRDLIPTVSVNVIRQVPELEFLLSAPLLTMVRFGQWNDVLRQSAPPPDLTYSVALWHYARGLALTAKGQLSEAGEARQKVQEISDAMPAERIVGLNSAKLLLGIASKVLTGQIAAKSGQLETAINDVEDAVRLQDALRYYEPPDWYYPVRESLGMLLLAVGRADDAEHVFREDLTRTPENPWSLHGLADSLRMQKKERDAALVEERFQKAWSAADIEFQPARFEAFLTADDTPTDTERDRSQ